MAGECASHHDALVLTNLAPLSGAIVLPLLVAQSLVREVTSIEVDVLEFKSDILLQIPGMFNVVSGSTSRPTHCALLCRSVIIK